MHFNFRTAAGSIAHRAGKGAVARLLNLAWSAVLIGLMATGTLSPARIGAMTWGPTHDIWSAAIAISQINFGLSGELGYHEVELAIASQVTSSKNAWAVFDDTTRRLDKDPDAVTRGLQAGAAVRQAAIAVPTQKDGYLTDWCEDLGYADFYNVAFRLFGFSALSTHWLYFSILTAEYILFAFGFFADGVAVASLALSVTALFLLSSSSIFTESVPSFAANRFLSTLAFIPLVHFLNFALRRAVVARGEIALLAAQSLIMSFAITARSSAEWCVIAAVACALALVGIRAFRAFKKKSLGGLTPRLLDRLAVPYLGRVLTGGTIVALVFLAYTVVRNATIAEQYFEADNYPHHLVWHSAYLGLSENPEWQTKRPPYADVPATREDRAGFLLFTHVMEERGLPYASSRGFYLARQYEPFIRQRYLKFLWQNPAFALKLFLYDKPVNMFTIIKQQLGEVPRISWLLAVFSLALATVCAAFGGSIVRISELVVGSLIIWSVSLLPLFWAYPSFIVDADQIWSFCFAPLMLICCMGASLVRLIGESFRIYATPQKCAEAAGDAGSLSGALKKT